MFILLTSADDGKPLHVRANAVLAIEAIDQATTHLVLAGAELLVRETPAKVRAMVTWEEIRTEPAGLPRPPALRGA